MSTLFLTQNNAAEIEPVTLSGLVPKRPTVRAPKFGQWLELKRGKRSFEQIAQKIRPLVEGVELKVDRSTIKKFEQGRVPSWPMLGAISVVYDVPIEETVERLRLALEFPAARDLLRHVSTVESSPLPGGGDVPASPSVRELQDRLAQSERDHAALVAGIRAVAGELTRLLAADEGAPARLTQPKARRGHRRAG